ncbi:hypothetical protein C1645_746511 [Glomus cerebriforme]|uniref:HMG box domain-containing protein n=1 Tax=Glomus cerebriforme TaxID=658196 RepID=A0A397TP63_9GLOM|nr:hypothetical protein C1645_746511 [Glomus cerebriforme]
METTYTIQDYEMETIEDYPYEVEKIDIFKDYGLELENISFEVSLEEKLENVPCKMETNVKPFEDPLNNSYFLHYLNCNIVSYDHFRLYNDSSYLTTLYLEYLNHLVENCRPDFPPNIKVEEFVDENQNNKKIKDMSKMNGGNSFMVYRKYLKKHLETVGINLPMQVLSLLSSILWRNESKYVKDHYRELSEQIKKLHSNNLQENIRNNSYKTIRNEKNMKQNGGNSFMIYRSKLHEYLKSTGQTLSMTELSSLASVLWHKEPDSVKTQFKGILDQTKKMLNEEISKLHYRQ